MDANTEPTRDLTEAFRQFKANMDGLILALVEYEEQCRLYQVWQLAKWRQYWAKVAGLEDDNG